MWLIISKFWVPKNFSGITFFPFVFVRDKSWAENTTFLNHEKIHIRQQLELLIFFFFIWYGIEFLIRLIKHRNIHQAYRNISFEKEAYLFENQPDYLKKRCLFSFLYYV